MFGKCILDKLHGQVILKKTITNYDCSWTRTHLNFGISRLLRARSSLTFRQINTECGFTLKRVRDMIRTYSQTNYDFVMELKLRLFWESIR